ncbi:hypothetical protein BN1723_003331 [Verticillium longisporum]|uniref:Histone H4 n=1 Tax=Verticillium longisporum TaxID=100787 RepID=A0A0G4LVG9_VERLO|nr:hypothetical protein BN1723_003331 [Verticillium longisporum]
MWRGGTCRTEKSVACKSDIREVDAQGSHILLLYSPIVMFAAETKTDSESEWPEPEAIKFTWSGKTKDGKAVEAVIEGDLGKRLDRVDVMAEVPAFVKRIVAGAAGTKPYIYQYSPQEKKLTLKLKIGDEEISEEGQLFSEATFISEARLARRGGVKFISGTIYNDIREVLIARLKLIIDDCIKYVDYRKAKTITVQDVLFTVRRFGQPIYGFDPGTNTESSPTKKR